MKVKLKELSIRNFKGVRSLDLEASDITEVYGENQTGKTTIMDAFLWLLFGKDSFGRADFSIKPRDKEGKIITRQECTVEGVFDIDGKKTTLKKTYKERWQQKKGQQELTFTGNENHFYVDDTPYSKTQYDKTISSIIDEELFRLVSSPKYFNSLEWKKRRDILFKMAGGIKDEDIIMNLQSKNKNRYKELAETLSKGHKADDFKKAINEKKRKIQKEMDDIPPRIDELKQRMPTGEDINQSWDVIKKKLTDKDTEIKEVEDQITNRKKAQENAQKELNQKYGRINEIQSEISRLRNDRLKQQREELDQIGDTLQKKMREKDQLKRKISDLEDQISGNKNDIAKYEEKIEKLRQQWYDENEAKLEFDENQFKCPTCGRDYEAEDIEEMKEKMRSNFNQNKAEKLDAINKEGRKLKEQKEKTEKDKQEAEEGLAARKNELSDLEQEISGLEEKEEKLSQSFNEEQKIKDEELAPELTAELSSLKKTLNDIQEDSYDDLNHKRDRLQEEKAEIKKVYDRKIDREKYENRIQELEKKEKDLSQQKADLERQEFAADEFIEEKVRIVEDSINSMFRYVQFRMFETQINGAKVPTCVTTIEGVPWRDANNGARIIAGLDIIRTLSEYYRVSAPVFIDNREAITNFPYDILPGGQLINLIVLEGQKEITVKHKTVENDTTTEAKSE